MKWKKVKCKEYNWNEYLLKIPFASYAVVCPEINEHKLSKVEGRPCKKWHGWIECVPCRNLDFKAITTKDRRKYKTPQDAAKALMDELSKHMLKIGLIIDPRFQEVEF